MHALPWLYPALLHIRIFSEYEFDWNLVFIWQTYTTSWIRLTSLWKFWMRVVLGNWTLKTPTQLRLYLWNIEAWPKHLIVIGSWLVPRGPPGSRSSENRLPSTNFIVHLTFSGPIETPCWRMPLPAAPLIHPALVSHQPLRGSLNNECRQEERSRFHPSSRHGTLHVNRTACP